MIIRLVVTFLLVATLVCAGTLTRPSGPTVVPDPPDGCLPGSVYIISGVQNCCQEDGITLLPCGSTSPNPTTGIRTTATDVQSIRYAVTEVSGTAQLGLHAIVMDTVGTAGSTLTVPDPADDQSPGWIKVIIADDGTGFLTLLPFGSTLINGSNTSPPPITGKRSSYELFRVSSNEWRVESFSRQGYGEPVFSGQDNTYTYGTHDFKNATALLGKLAADYAPTAAASFGFNSTNGAPVVGENGTTKTLGGTLFVGYNGSTNDSSSGSGSIFDHTPSYTIPANFLTLGKVIKACAGLSVTTGSAAPALGIRWRIADTSIGVPTDITPSNNLVSRGLGVCIFIVAGEAPSASSDLYTAPVTVPTAVTTGTIANFTTAQPRVHATNGTLSLEMSTIWLTAGTGTNTIKLESLIVEALN